MLLDGGQLVVRSLLELSSLGKDEGRVDFLKRRQKKKTGGKKKGD
jgi:hypothetical protein